MENRNYKLKTHFVHIRLNDELYNELLHISDITEVKLPNVLRRLCDLSLDHWDSLYLNQPDSVLPMIIKPVHPERTITLRLSIRLFDRIKKYMKVYDRNLPTLVYSLISNGNHLEKERMSA